jgi:hypothetical protein
MEASCFMVVATCSIALSMIRRGISAGILCPKHDLEARKAANQYRDTAFNHAPKGKPRDFRMDAFSVGYDDTSYRNANDKYAKAQHGKQAKLLPFGDFDACDYGNRESHYYQQISIRRSLRVVHLN